MTDNTPVYFRSNKTEVTDELIAADLNEVGCGEDSDEEAEEEEKSNFVPPMLELLESKLEWCQPWFGRDVLETIAEMGSSVKIPGPPAGWTAPATNTAAGEPDFSDVDNPGGWPEFIFRPVFNRNKYTHHSLPTGAIPVPKNKDGRRIINGWEFFYNGYDGSDDESEDKDGDEDRDNDRVNRGESTEDGDKVNPSRRSMLY